MTSQPALIKGRVRQSGGQPIAGARVLFASAPGAVPDIAALTDDTGYFSLSAPWAGDYALEVVADGFQSQRIAATVAAGGTRDLDELNVELQPAP
jgi:Carboxypeptidase regulatory-like domain